MDAVFSIFKTLGLDSPFARFVFVGAGGTGVEYLVKPSYAFDEQGEPRPWAKPWGENAPGAVYTPVGFFPILLGLCAALFF